MNNDSLVNALHILNQLNDDDQCKISIPTAYLQHFLNPHHAFIFKQVCFYWSLKRGGWNYCSHKEMGKQFGMNEQQVRRSVKYLSDNGYIETRMRMVNGSQTTDFKVIPDKIIEVFDQPSHPTVATVTFDGSITDSTTDRTKPNNKHTVIDVESQFTRLWDAFPKKVKKIKSKAAYKRVVKGHSQLWVDDFTNKLINNFGQRLDAGEWKLDEKQFIPCLEAYLNGERWKDEILQTKPKGKPSLMAQVNSMRHNEKVINPPQAPIVNEPLTIGAY